MMETIRNIKNEILQQAENEILERGIERTDMDRLDKMANIVHHLAESEMACWKACHYRNLAMEEMGKGDAIETETESASDELIAKLNEEYLNLSADEKVKMKYKILTSLGSM